MEQLDRRWEVRVVWRYSLYSRMSCCCNCAPRLFRVQGSGKRHPTLHFDWYRRWESEPADRPLPVVGYRKQDCPVYLELRCSTSRLCFLCSYLTLAVL